MNIDGIGETDRQDEKLPLRELVKNFTEEIQSSVLAIIAKERSPIHVEVHDDRIEIIKERIEKTRLQIIKIIESIILLPSSDVEVSIDTKTRSSLLGILASLVPFIEFDHGSSRTQLLGSSTAGSFGRKNGGIPPSSDADQHIPNDNFHPNFMVHTTFNRETPPSLMTDAEKYTNGQVTLEKVLKEILEQIHEGIQ